MKSVLLSALAIACVAPFATNAMPISYDFTVSGGVSGPLAGVTSSGFFTYESDGKPPTAIVNGTGLLTDLAFTWNGIDYDESNANTGFLAFVSGPLFVAQFGTDCRADGSCSAGPFSSNSWFISTSTRNSSPAGLFVYEFRGATFDGEVQSISRRTSSVSEPGTSVLMGLGLAMLMLAGGGHVRGRLQVLR